MTLGEKLLALTVEYSNSTNARSSDYSGVGGSASGREPSEIGAEYEATLRELLG